MFTDGNSEVIPDVMKTDIKERDGQFLIEIELPGYKKENIIAQLANGYLTIIAVRNEAIEKDDGKTNYVLKERNVGEIKRSFYVGEEITQHDIQAGLNEGILSVIISSNGKKVEMTDVKMIPID